MVREKREELEASSEANFTTVSHEGMTVIHECETNSSVREGNATTQEGH